MCSETFLLAPMCLYELRGSGKMEEWWIKCTHIKNGKKTSATARKILFIPLFWANSIRAKFSLCCAVAVCYLPSLSVNWHVHFPHFFLHPLSSTTLLSPSLSCLRMQIKLHVCWTFNNTQQNSLHSMTKSLCKVRTLSTQLVSACLSSSSNFLPHTTRAAAAAVWSSQAATGIASSTIITRGAISCSFHCCEDVIHFL